MFINKEQQSMCQYTETYPIYVMFVFISTAQRRYDIYKKNYGPIYKPSSLLNI